MNFYFPHFIIFCLIIIISPIFNCHEEAEVERVVECFNQNASFRNASRDIYTAKIRWEESFVELIKVVDTVDLDQIELLKQCVDLHYPNLSIEIPASDYYGAGNKVISVNGLVKRLMPDFFHHMVFIADAAINEAGN